MQFETKGMLRAMSSADLKPGDLWAEEQDEGLEWNFALVQNHEHRDLRLSSPNPERVNGLPPVQYRPEVVLVPDGPIQLRRAEPSATPSNGLPSLALCLAVGSTSIRYLPKGMASGYFDLLTGSYLKPNLGHHENVWSANVVVDDKLVELFRVNAA